MSSNFRFSGLSGLIEEAVISAEAEILIAAPYIKIDALSRFKFPKVLRDRTTVVSRWRASDIVSGSTDVEIYPWLRDQGCSLRIHPTLHAKYYRIDNEIWTGSANLTRNGLAGHQGGNLEVLTRVSENQDSKDFELKLLAESIEVTNEIYLDYLSIQEIKQPENSRLDVDFFWPGVNSFEQIWSPYAAGKNSEILEILECPSGLSQIGLRSYVKIRLREFENVRTIEKFLLSGADGRRFGEVRALIRDLDEEVDETVAWQNLMSLLLDLFPDKFEYSRPNYTEVIKVRKTD